ncbi:hypothetical protein LTR10_022530 [Elasticomyces elasticus]|uniref:FAD-dependent oxidoreductase 2 FAD-binding domain-containing protein n=1 Tax=Exophiala sideris TaxID=1016849 RepID=A0ABR0JG50_9EURO|nr:hypothetical protein LTR10_022530 [Elasticomyces elasticus]KAK5024024.1 hypothetical protein LTR13_011042 [Exophiala sideris]KAK5025588.1 hypothetical protein LTS07_007792 [Exophiala sideris]KAK5063687.1 hypothetical protein LTR69_004393 [Exophiala sideris]KAK5176373.1 hypothetical protein LTR44_011057 [Eurotiomycetes sp. CCFEE 6388]
MAPHSQPVIIVGAGLSGLVAAYELTRKNIPVTIIDQEPEGSLGGQAFWSLGGIFCVNSADQRSKGIKDSRELALADWLNTAKFDREKEDHWPRQWAKAFVDFATDDMEKYLKNLGVKFILVGWAERGSGSAHDIGNSVPRFHLTWGTGPEIVRVFAEPVRAAEQKGLVTFKFRHKVDDLVVDENGAAVGVRGQVLEPSDAVRGAATSRQAVDSFELRGRAVLMATGGIGGDVEKVKKAWPKDRLGPNVPKSFVVGVPAHVDGRMIDIAKDAGANVVNVDRMWHYTEGLQNWNPIWPAHGIRVIPGPSSMWLDAAGYDYSWYVTNRRIVSKEFALSGSEQNYDLTSKSYLRLLQRALTRYGTYEVQDFLKNGDDFVVENDLTALVEGMNLKASERGGPILELDAIRKEIEARDVQAERAYTKDAKIMLINNARQYGPDARRIPKPHKIIDPSAGPLVAVRMNLLTRKSLGGLETNLDSNVMRPDGQLFPGLYAAGEAAGIGGGGVHGYSSLEGTFLGGCIFSGRTAGRALVNDIVPAAKL